MNLGPCKLTFNSELITETIEEKDATITIESDVKDIKTDESNAVKEQLEDGELITVFKCSLPWNERNISLFELEGTDKPQLKKGELIIETLNGNVLITFYNASIKLIQKLDLKKGKFGEMELTATALPDSFNKRVDLVLI